MTVMIWKQLNNSMADEGSDVDSDVSVVLVEAFDVLVALVAVYHSLVEKKFT